VIGDQAGRDDSGSRLVSAQRALKNGKAWPPPQKTRSTPSSFARDGRSPEVPTPQQPPLIPATTTTTVVPSERPPQDGFGFQRRFPPMMANPRSPIACQMDSPIMEALGSRVFVQVFWAVSIAMRSYPWCGRALQASDEGTGSSPQPRRARFGFAFPYFHHAERLQQGTDMPKRL
jgi:hypothetical protein